MLLDGITMKKGLAVPFRVMRYMKRNLPRLERAQVQLLTTLAVDRVAGMIADMLNAPEMRDADWEGLAAAVEQAATLIRPRAR